MARRLALSVSQLNEYVRRLLQQDPLLCEVELKGEISNLKRHQTGTLFFTLKDELAAISCVMYASDVCMLQVEPFDGMRALVTGSVGLYTRGGQYQFYARSIQAQGLGVLYERYQMLKEKLEYEGLFSPENKRSLPFYPSVIGVVSSPTGAVIHDIMSVALRRDETANIMLCPVRVQGSEAADEVIQAIHMLESMENVDVIIVARGGGSIEDLWTFNEERVVRAVAACRKPIVSAIGHETDYTLCDFAADLRAPTPSAAAECVTPVRRELLDHIAALKREMNAQAVRSVRQARMSLLLSTERLRGNHPLKRIETHKTVLHGLRSQLMSELKLRMDAARQTVAFRRRELEMLNPYRVLERGYAIVMGKQGPVMSASEAAAGDRVRIVLKDGSLGAQILQEHET